MKRKNKQRWHESFGDAMLGIREVLMFITKIAAIISPIIGATAIYLAEGLPVVFLLIGLGLSLLIYFSESLVLKRGGLITGFILVVIYFLGLFLASSLRPAETTTHTLLSMMMTIPWLYIVYVTVIDRTQ